MNFQNCKLLIIADFNRFQAKHNFIILIKYILFNPSFKITFWFRIGSYLLNKKSLISKILYLIVFSVYKHNQFQTGIQLPFGTDIGKGLSFSHFSCIVINSGAKIGNYCTIFQGVTVGSVRGSGSPIIGNNVVLGAGSKVIGNIRIGNNVFIGANSVVVKDIPDESVVVGNPSYIVNMNGIERTRLYLYN